MIFDMILGFKIINLIFNHRKIQTMKPIECLTNLQKHMTDIVLYSGRYLFRLGKYNQCIQTESLDYYFIQMGAKGTDDQSLFMGTCLPAACTNNTVHSLINFVLNEVNIPLEVKSVQTKIGQFQYGYTWPFFLTFFLLTMLVTLVIVASISQKSRESRLVGAFSINQTRKLFKYSPGSRLNILNGIRSLSMFWVIYGHTMSMSVGFSQNILTVEKNILSNWKFLTVGAALYSVDIFFFVGGFLVAYAFLKEVSLTKVKYLLGILNRILRLLPSYFIAIMIYYAVFSHLGKGPFWQNQLKMSELCSSFWRPLLFVDNFVDNGENMCMGWGWYLQNDIQLFLYSMLILLIYTRSKFWGNFTIFLSMTANFAFVMGETFQNKQKWLNHMDDAKQSAKYQLDIYYKPWGRCPPYLYGLFLGILYSEFLAFQSKIKNKKQDKGPLKQNMISQMAINSQESKQMVSSANQRDKQQQKIPFLQSVKQMFESKPIIRRLIQLFGLSICLFICAIPRTNQGQNYWPQFVHSFYLTYAKLGFVFGLSLIILPSLILPVDEDKKHQKLLVRFLMDTKFFNYIAKVSFCTYLIQLTLLLLYFGSFTVDFQKTFIIVFVIFVAFSVFSVFIGTLFVFIVEAPFSKLQKQFIKKISKRKKSNKKQNKIVQQEAEKKPNKTTAEKSINREE